MTTTKVQDIAVVSFAPFLNGDVEAQKAVSEKIRNAFSEIGFLYLIDHGIPEELLNEVYSAGKRFFGLPLETKKKWKVNAENLSQGYSPEGAEAGDGVDHKESYEHGRFQNRLCPTDAELQGFKSTMDTFHKACLHFSQVLMRCLAMAIGMPENSFDYMTENADPQLRINHYFPLSPEVLAQEKHARIVPHTDFGFFTLLFQDSVGGLQVDPWHTGEFKAVKPIPGAMLVNIADLLQRLSNGRLKSTIHRVMAPSHSVDGNIPERYSIPFFFYPDPEVLIDPLVLEESEVKKYKAVKAGEYKQASILATYPEFVTGPIAVPAMYPEFVSPITLAAA